MQKVLYTQDKLTSVVSKILDFACSRDNAGFATVVALSGDLGAGKTTFVQELARVLGVKDQVTSPTFVVMKKYQTPDLVFSELIHIDAYRIENANEMEVLGFFDWLKNPKTIICVEWPEKISSLIPGGAVRVSLDVVDKNTREIIYDQESK